MLYILYTHFIELIDVVGLIITLIYIREHEQLHVMIILSEPLSHDRSDQEATFL